MNDNKNKIRIGITISEDVVKLADDNLKNANCRSRSELIEEAIEFYVGYNNSEKSSDFFCTAITTTVHGIIAQTEKRLSTIGFKQVVASLKMSKLLSLFLELDKEQERKIYLEALDEAKKINGTIPIIEYR